MSYSQYNNPCNPCTTGIGLLDDQRRRIEEDLRLAQEFDRYYRVRDGHRPHLR
ncbi:hypothetical protein PDESU_03630 [Pontiella desulfatans]|uniref:Uncharacterized protein n=1 Tax=Pontiella desulfatans TaxID=2750659 RepID=A0A6C2U4Z0_PONDE|nr:hypothetical protein [Pontiella desulfatans]VGO15050.1 hypothetical protein PDESU_03630 [Pontiella desulfatans]